MTTSFPSGLDALTNPNAGDAQNSPSHSAQHQNSNDAIEAIEARVGITSSADTTSHDYLIAHNGTPMGLSGATQSTRYVGARASATPTANTWALGDFMILQNGAIGVCTAAGTPGTWVTISPSGAVSMTLADYIIYKSGSNFLARNTSTGVDDFTNTNAASVVQSAHDALGRAGLIELKRGVAYTATSMVTLSQAGVMVRSSEQSGEDQSTSWTVTSALANDSAAFRVTGSGAGIGGISVDANGNADYGIDLRGGGQMCFNANMKNANVANFYLDGPNGAARCMFWNLRSDNGTNQAAKTVTGVVRQGVTSTYRFTTSTAHNYLANQVVILQGFVTTGGKFQNPITSLPATITNIDAVSHLYFDVDLDVAQTFTTSTGTSKRAAMNFKLDGPDHIGWGLRSTGTSTAGYSLWMDTSRCQIASGHITGNNDEAGAVYISGAENRLSDFYLDTGPDGDNGVGHLTIAGSGNWVSALVQNAATQTAKTVTGVAFVSGTTYRFTTSTANNYVVGNAVWLEGFASSTGFFNGTTTGNVLVTGIDAVNQLYFDADLGASTTFTTSTGTSKKICKYGLLMQKPISTSYIQGNELHLTFQGKGANANTGEFYYAAGFLDENGNDITSFARFAGNRIFANAAKTTRFSNMEATWGTTTHVDKIFVDAWSYQQDTTTPTVWRTDAQGLTAASTATSWTVTHGLAGLPKMIQITPNATLTNQVTWVSGVTATQFTINASASITNGKFYWMAEM